MAGITAGAPTVIPRRKPSVSPQSKIIGKNKKETVIKIMKSKFKKLFLCTVTACLCLAICLATACNDKPDDGDPAKDGYIVTVLYPDDKPLKGSDGDTQWDFPSVELVNADGNRVDERAISRLNESGVAQIPYTTPGEYYIRIVDCPSGYYHDYLTAKTSANKAYYTVKLVYAEPSAYTFSLKYFDGTDAAFSDVELTLYTDRGVEVAKATTDAQGVAVTPVIDRGEYYVSFSVAGYICKPLTTTVGKTEVDVTLYRYAELSLDNPLAGEELDKWDKALNAPELGINRFYPSVNNYVYSVDLAANEEVFYTFTAPKTGAYRLGSMRGNDYKIQIYNADFTAAYDDYTIASSVNMPNQVTEEIRVIGGEKLSFSVKHNSDAAGKVEFIVCFPESYIETITASAVGEHTLVFDTDSKNECWLYFPTEDFGQGVYKFTSLLSADDNLDVYIVKYFNGMPIYATSNGLEASDGIKDEHVGCAGDDNGAGDGKNFSFTDKFPPSYVGPTIQYHVIIKGEPITARTTVKVNIERLGDAEDKKTVVHDISATATAQYGDQTGTFTWVDFSAKDNEITDDGGKWYITVDNVKKPLVIAITKLLHNQEYSFATVEYFGEAGFTENNQQNSKLTIQTESNDEQDVYSNYSDFIKHYKNLVNRDGVYELNSELKLFAESYMNRYYGDFTGQDEHNHPIKPAIPWLIACGYYA